MPYCVNCGTPNSHACYVCAKCYGDPVRPDSQQADLLRKLAHDPELTERYPDFTYTNEKLSLISAILITTIVSVLVTAASLGIAIVLFALALISHRVNWARTRAELLRVTPQSFPVLDRLTKLACSRLLVPPPPVFIIQSPQLNAYTTGLFGENWIVIHSSLVDTLTPTELLSVIGHELGHIRMRHVTWLTFVNPGQHAFRIPVVAELLAPVFNNWRLRSEFTADRAGVIACGEPGSAVAAQLKLLGGGAIKEHVDFNALMREITDEEDQPQDTVLELLFETHPHGRRRIRQMLAFSKSEAFMQIHRKYV